MMTSVEQEPLVSCIMPTADRRRFAPQAILNFLAQDYAGKELIILDDGTDSIADLVPNDERIRYLRSDQKQSLGAKRNECVKLSRGGLIMHWDDDDWSAPHRIRYQVDAMLGGRAALSGLRQMLFYDPAGAQTWLYSYPANQRLWLAGGSLLYTREFWQRAPFPDIQVGEDARFVWSQRKAAVAVLPEFRFYVAMIHSSNTSPKVCGGPYWSRWCEDLRQVMGDDLSYYQSDAERQPHSPVSAIRLNLGCNDSPLNGFVNVDSAPGLGVDQVVDLQQPWPWADDSVSFIRANDVIEHLQDKILTMNEMYRVLAPGGSVEVSVPTTDGPGAFQDPTHVSFWNRRSFVYYECGSPYRERFAQRYGICAKFRTVWERTDRSVDGPRLTIMLAAVKP
jgi:glycosyltransferase involved in cell wall biosynthesis